MEADPLSAKALTDTADVAAGVLVIGTLADWLPPVAAGFAIVWTGIRIYEHVRWVRKGRPPRN